MAVLHGFNSNNNPSGKSLNSLEIFSVYYHSIFKYPLTFSELVKWTPKNAPEVHPKVEYKNGLYFIEGSENLIYKRSMRKRFSQKKRKIAEKASKIISLIPSVKMVAISGSLAMENAGKESDIDMIIITSEGSLWTTRILVYTLLKIFGLSVRNPKNSKQMDKLCLNIWLDEKDMSWNKKERNFYTAHEILQTVPLVDKKGTYRKFLTENRWALSYWPNVVEIKLNKNLSNVRKNRPNVIEKLAFKVQLLYMKGKITREVITSTKAIFHPNNLSIKVLSKMTP